MFSVPILQAVHQTLDIIALNLLGDIFLNPQVLILDSIPSILFQDWEDDNLNPKRMKGGIEHQICHLQCFGELRAIILRGSRIRVRAGKLKYTTQPLVNARMPGDKMSHSSYLILTLTVEICPLDGGGTSGTPAKLEFLAMVPHSKITLLRQRVDRSPESQPISQIVGCQHAC